jgi:hypothetical protein
MSLESWKQLYYPISADEAAKLSPVEIIQHSLTKWRGLRKEVLAEHGLIQIGHTIQDATFLFSILGDTCSLCAKYYDSDFDEPSCCSSCPLAQLGASGTDCFTEYRHWRTTLDPEPMIRLLEKALQTAQPN